jgi:predicted HicB family RNase H-like nuclease
MDTMEYKSYRGSVRYSAEDRVLHGRILGIDDVVNFEGANVDELERAFHEAVDDYLALCEKLGRPPEREYAGKIPLRIDPEIHRRVAIAADSEAKSVNGWIADTLVAAVEKVWAVKKAGASEPESRHRTKKGAVRAAKRKLSKKRGGKMLVFGSDGRIKDSDTVARHSERGRGRTSSKQPAASRARRP